MPRAGQVWRHNKRRRQNVWLVLDASKGDAGWKLSLLNLESGEELLIVIRTQHESWERIA